MKLAKMSLAAAMLLGVNLYAIDNVKVNGSAKLNYQTVDSDVDDAPDMFDKDASAADIALDLGITADLSEGVSAGVSITAVTTLGLENNLVSNTWSNAHKVSGSTGASFAGSHLGVDELQVEDEMWVGEAWIAGTLGKTTAKLGRQAIDTPYLFSETWGIDMNTIEGAVVINQDLPDTTLVGAWVGKSNGSADDENSGDIFTLNKHGAAAAGYVAREGKFSTFGKDGAYAAGVINNSWKPLTAQGWYYEAQGLAQAYWLQADLDFEGILAGVQFANIDPEEGGLSRYLGTAVASTDDTNTIAAMLGYAMKDVVTVKAAYSTVDDDGTLGAGNMLTGSAATVGGQSKLYTEMWWSYGYVSTVGADTFSITAEGTVADVDLFLGFYSAEIDIDENNAALAGVLNPDQDVMEVALTASKSFGPLDATLAVIYDDIDFDDDATYDDEEATTLQVYLTYNF